MKMIDLFAGIGGFSLAASRVWPEHETVAFVEINKFCQQVLRKNFGENISIIEDIKTFNAERFRGTVDVISAGTPCQPASQAGKRLGKSDDRWLWGETFRVIREIRPTWFVLENVRGLLTLEQGMVFDELLSEMETIGYEVQPFNIPAASVNAPHKRERIWFLGRSNNTPHAGCEHGTRKTVEGKLAGTDRQSDAAESERSTGCDGVRIAWNAESNRETEEREIHSENSDPFGIDGDTEQIVHAADTDNAGGGTPGHDAYENGTQVIEGLVNVTLRGSGRLGSDATDTERVLSQRLYARQRKEQFGGDGWKQNWLQIAARFCRMDDDVPAELYELETSDRTNRLKALGNSIVPAVAEMIFRAIKYADEQEAS